MLDAMTGAPAYGRNGHMDILAANRLGYALYSDLYENPRRPVNSARFAFLWAATVEREEPAEMRDVNGDY